jgi:hypothetical protein
MEVWDKLLRAGFIPFCPHWSALQHLYNPELEHQQWLDYDFHWLECCDVLLRMPGESKGADAEELFALSLGKRVYGYGGNEEQLLVDCIKVMKGDLIDQPGL